MNDVASDLKERFDFAMYLNLEAYEVLPDGKSIVRSDDAESAIDIFKNLRDSVDSIPPSLITAADELRAVAPDLFEETLVYGIQMIRFELTPTSATEFVEGLNRTVRHDMACA
jgi:hypothetical protein